LDSQFPKKSLPELKTHTTAKDWSLESRGLAIKYGYLDGNLKGGTNSESAQRLPDGYTKAAKAVAEHQGALAGYRLADEIEKFLKTGKAVPYLPKNTFKAKTTIPKKIGTAEANQFYDEEMTVTGKVVAVSSRGNVTILNFDKTYPDTPFTAVVFQENFDQFKNLKELQGKQVEVKGTVTDYRNKPEIILETPNQLKVVGSK
jgi:hypothetical protein